MLNKLPPLKESPSQTAGPYVHIGLTPSLECLAGANISDLGTGPVPVSGNRIIVAGRVFDGSAAPVSDAVIELWQADAEGNYGNAFGRAACDSTGGYRFDTVKPGRVGGPDGKLMAPHLTLWIVARGINIGLHTRVYFDDEAEANETDFGLNRIMDLRRRKTLIAAGSDAEGKAVYTFDIRLQGEDETVFFDI